MHADQRVDARYLEHPGDAPIPYDKIEMAAAVRRRARGLGEHPDAGRVQEGAGGEVDHDLRPRWTGREGLLQPRCRGEVEVSDHVRDEPAGRGQLGAYVKITRRGHGGRV